MRKELACQEQLRYPDMNRYTEVQAKQRLKWLMLYLISKGTFFFLNNVALEKVILCTSLYYFTAYVRKQTQRENKKQMEKNNLVVTYSSRWTSVSKAAEGRQKQDVFSGLGGKMQLISHCNILCNTVGRNIFRLN